MVKSSNKDIEYLSVFVAHCRETQIGFGNNLVED